MKILLISPTQKGIGGIAKAVNGLSHFLTKNGNYVDIISSENTFTIPIKGLKNPSFIVSSYIKTKFRKKYDIVHAHNPPSAIAMKNISGKKILSMWGQYSEQVKALHGKTTGKFSVKLEKEALDIADAIIVASKEVKRYYTELGYNVFHIPNAINLNELPKNQDRRFDNQIIYVGRLSKEKGILNLIQIAEKLPDTIHLIILGNGPEEEKVKRLEKTKKNVHYLGFQPKDMTIPLIRGSDIIIQPSLMEGGLNTTLLEAMACKTPILATDLHVYKDEIRHMNTGFCVKPDFLDDFLEGISKLLGDQKLRHSLATNAYNEVKKYSWDVIGKDYLEIYNNVINGK